MRPFLKFVGIGSLTLAEKWESRKGKMYLKGKLLCDCDPQVEVGFCCFNDGIVERVCNEDIRGEKVKIIGGISNWREGINVTARQLLRTKAVNDQAEFQALGILSEVNPDGELLSLVIEAKRKYKGQEYISNLDVTTNNTESFRERVTAIKGRCVLVKGSLRQILEVRDSDEDSYLICWLNSINMVSEQIQNAKK